MIQVLSLTVFALLLARVMRAPAGSWRWIVAAAAALLALSQLLPAGNALREDVRGSAGSLLWLGLALVPVAGYALLVRGIRRRTLAPPPAPSRPFGLVLIPDDGALAADTEAALAAETGRGRERLSVGWRNAAGELVGHARLRLDRGMAHLDLLWVAERERRQGIGGRLLDQAAREARHRGAEAMLAAAGPGLAAGFLERRGFAQYGAIEAGAAWQRHFHRALGP